MTYTLPAMGAAGGVCSMMIGSLDRYSFLLRYGDGGLRLRITVHGGQC